MPFDENKAFSASHCRYQQISNAYLDWRTYRTLMDIPIFPRRPRIETTDLKRLVMSLKLVLRNKGLEVDSCGHKRGVSGYAGNF